MATRQGVQEKPAQDERAPAAKWVGGMGIALVVIGFPSLMGGLSASVDAPYLLAVGVGGTITGVVMIGIGALIDYVFYIHQDIQRIREDSAIEYPPAQ